jgi:hypothetical protein
MNTWCDNLACAAWLIDITREQTAGPLSRDTLDAWRAERTLTQVMTMSHRYLDKEMAHVGR